MPQINDCIYNAVGGPVNDFLLAYYQANGATSDDMMTAAKEFLAAQGATDGALMDMWREFLTGKGYAGALADQLYQFWCIDLGAVCDSGATKDGSGACNPYYILINFCDTPHDMGETPYDGMTLSVNGDTTSWALGQGIPSGPNEIAFPLSMPLTSFETNIVAMYDGTWISPADPANYNINNSCIPDPVKIQSLPEFDAITGRMDIGDWYNNRSGAATFINADGFVQEVSNKILIQERARVVENLLPVGTPEVFDSSHSNWDVSNGSVDNGDGTITMPQGGRALFQANSYDAVVETTDRTILASVEIKGPAGKDLEIRYQGDGPVFSFTDGSILTFGSRHTCNGEWQRVTPGYIVDPWSQDGIRVVLENDAGDLQGSFDIELRRAQIEISNWTTDPEIPSEYESVSSGFGIELYDDANAASDQDVDAITGFAYSGGTPVSQSAVTNGSNFAIQHVVTSTAGRITLDLDNFCAEDTDYIIEIDVRHVGSGGDWILNVGSSTTDTTSPVATLTSADTTWKRYTISISSYSSSDRYLILRENNAGNDGGVYIDNLSIKYARNGVGYYNYANGNSVDANGVITEAAGAAISETPWLRHAPGTTNVMPRSHELGSWILQGAAILSADNAVSPDGLTTADKLQGQSASNDGVRYSITTTNGVTYSLSAFIKPDDSQTTRLSAGGASTAYVDVAWTAGVPSTAASSGATNITYEECANGWYRVGFLFTSSSTSTSVQLHPDRDNLQRAAWFWGVQLEQNGCISPFVYTSGSSASSTSDVIRYTRTAENWDNDRGTVVLNAQFLNPDLNTKFGNRHLFGTNTAYYTTMYSSTTANLRSYDNTTDANSVQVSGDSLGVNEELVCGVSWDITWGKMTIGSKTTDVPTWDTDETDTYNYYQLRDYVSLLSSNPNTVKVLALDVYDKHVSQLDIDSRYTV